jgi:putative spermidine/putrescine transport system permease protein
VSGTLTRRVGGNLAGRMNGVLPGRPRLSSRRVTAIVSHGYIWLCLIVFVLPFFALLVNSLSERGGVSGLENFQDALGSFGDNLLWSFKITGLTLLLNLAISLPAGYALVRYPVPGRRLVFSLLQLSLYVPGAVIGLSLLLTYTFTYHQSSMWGLVLAMVVGTFPLMLTPIVVALKDLPLVFEEAALCLGATKWQTYRRIVFPLIGPGVSAGLLLCFIIVFNEYLVTLFVHPPDLETAPLRVFNLVRTNGLAPTTSALAVVMQLVSFLAVLVFFRAFGSRHFKGPYIL